MQYSHVIRLFAPSGFSTKEEKAALAIKRLQKVGFIVDNTEAVYRRQGRFAGTDAQRTADLQDIVTGKAKVPDILLAIRGGYGAMRILPRINWVYLGDIMREHNTLLVGFSDITAIQLALLAQSKVASFAGPMLISDFGRAKISLFTVRSFIKCITKPILILTIKQDCLPTLTQSLSHSIKGIFWGGNLSILAALVGTPYMPEIKDGILFIEESGESIYRIERMLQTLYLSGILMHQQAIVLGVVKQNLKPDYYDQNYTLASIINYLQYTVRIPVFTGLRFGHVAEKVTLPLGAWAEISLQRAGYQIQFSNYPVIQLKG